MVSSVTFRKPPGAPLQCFVPGLEHGELDEPLALGHDEKIRLQTAEDSIDIGVEIRLEFVEIHLKRKRHQEPLP